MRRRMSTPGTRVLAKRASKIIFLVSRWMCGRSNRGGRSMCLLVSYISKR